MNHSADESRLPRLTTYVHTYTRLAFFCCASALNLEICLFDDAKPPSFPGSKPGEESRAQGETRMVPRRPACSDCLASLSLGDGEKGAFVNER